LEHPKFDAANSRLAILLVWRFKWHVYGNQHKRHNWQPIVGQAKDTQFVCSGFDDSIRRFCFLHGYNTDDAANVIETHGDKSDFQEPIAVATKSRHPVKRDG
jgi:hypothetical protein